MNITTAYLLIGAALGFFLGYKKLNAAKRVYKKTPTRPFPALWRQILTERVHFYNQLSNEDKIEFERKVHLFLLNVRIKGMDTEVSHVDKVLIAAGAVIPIFRFSNWNYGSYLKIELYPDKFQIPNSEKMANGLVGWGTMEGKVMLSRKAVHHGFYDHSDNKNVVIHEFIHILDKQDGNIDGIMVKR